MKHKWFNLNEDGEYSLKVAEEEAPKVIKKEIKEEPKKGGEARLRTASK